MYPVTTLDKDLYDQARVFGKINSMLACAKLCTPKVNQQIKMHLPEFENLLSRFDLTQDQTGSVTDLQNSLQKLKSLLLYPLTYDTNNITLH